MPPKKQAAKQAKVDAKKKEAQPASKSKAAKKKEPSPPKADPKRSAPTKKDDPPSKAVKKTKSQDKIVKVITKGGAAVDAFVPGKDSYRVFQDGGKVYSATLNQSNLDHNNNKFYIIQILQNQQSNVIFTWNRWGRVGVPGQNALKGPFSKEQALSDYNSKYRAKTSSGDYKQIEIKYEDEEEKQQKKPKVEAKGSAKKKDVATKIDQGLQKLINLIFDVNIMNSTMKEIGYDAKRMPLGKLGDKTIKEAYGILNKLNKAIKAKDTAQYKTLSSQFYTLIPHDFGFKNMMNFILDNDEKVRTKLKMLETISDMKITTKLLDQKADEDESVLDQNYKKLGCNIKTVDQKSGDYKLLNEYFNNTKGSSYNKVKIGQIYEVVREDQQKEFNKKIGNNMLLWHGSRVSNFVGILSQGLRIAPPEAPASGYNFGKGIYLADLAEKSIAYCRSGSQPSALIILIEGAIGKPNILLNPNYQAKELAQKNGKDSTKCHGAKAPPESSFTNHKGAIIPKGAPVSTGSGSYMGHNEFIVYNKNQAKIKYIMRMDMTGS